jgi:phosphoglycerol transferase MdoB-like AlkP superfamily enzyme
MKKLSNYSLAKIFAIFAILSFLLRTIFLVWQNDSIDFSLITLTKVYSFGFLFDAITFGYLFIIPAIYFFLIPNRIFNNKIHQKINQILYFLFLSIIVFSCFAEVVFWEEFQTRFNFIAVDYLIYTTEVIGNIVESYPIFLLISIILAIAASIFVFSRKIIVIEKTGSYLENLRKLLIILVFVVTSFFVVDSSKLAEISKNHYVNEIAKNGIHELFSAYRNNEIDYESFYTTVPQNELITNLRNNVSKQEPKSKFLNDEDISRLISKPENGSEKRYNVIFVAIESLSADFMEAFGNKENITPNLDVFAKQGLFFTNLKATGTRTVRGLEALSLSVPPTPGNSIVRRPNNENLFNISSPFKARGYEAKFIYGGDGYFDNMKYFFGNNGFEVVDRPEFSSDEITFNNAWGVSDEDLFDKTIKEADKSYSKGKPFFNFVMTTSNHRPFTYPEGKIDIAPKSGRNGAVKYSDYAIGKLVEKSRNKEWFKNTIFVFVADHCAGSAGNTDVPLWRYQIPTIFYAPEIIKPRVFDENISQIDIAPTLMGIFNFEYKSKFFGTDVLNNQEYLDKHAFVSTYSDIGYFEGDELYLLKPKKEKKFFKVIFEKYGWQGSKEVTTGYYEQEELIEVISYYQGASYLFKNGKLKDFDQ